MKTVEELKLSLEILQKIFYSAQDVKEINVPPSELRDSIDALGEKISGMTTTIPVTPQVGSGPSTWTTITTTGDPI